jgi:uncharacterized membrane protein
MKTYFSLNVIPISTTNKIIHMAQKKQKHKKKRGFQETQRYNLLIYNSIVICNNG